MKQTIIYICLLTLASLISSCSSKSEKSQGSNTSNIPYSSTSDNENEKNEEGLSQPSESNDSEVKSGNSSDCKFEDGTYSATVDYNNPQTGYSTTYTLDVEVQDCQVVQINFPNDGYLDEDHISYADIDEDGNATVDGEDGKTYEIQIDD